MGCGEGESRCRGGSRGLGLADGEDLPRPSTPRSESSCDSSDEEDATLSPVSVVGFSSCWAVTVLFGVDASDEDEDEDESSSEDEVSDTTLLFRFLFLLFAGFGCPGPIC